MTFTANDVKSLRERTGAGMMDCKKALTESQGNVDDAIEILRKQGLASASKKAGRVAAEGMIAHQLDAKARTLAMVEVNCETDFVVKTPEFSKLADDAAQLIATQNPADVAALLQLKVADQTVEAIQVALVAKIGENIGVRRFLRTSWNDKQDCAIYTHTGSKIAAAIVYDDPNKKMPAELARDIAMHITAMNPQYVRQSDVPAEFIAKEKEISLASMADQKKPAEIMEKIVAGKIQKYLADICLEDQIFVKDLEGKRSVSKVLAAIDKDIRITQMLRLQVGEGVEKKKEDFAEEVAKMMQ
ncbi:MAG: elongation factor Ts [Deltaproteobacteria bacterium CG11_big_fil_rev_8_21_14_0_20_47_16]|nr:MAG: elongation factor Ts [Deltaproteobacteria bacterium CG11_big_fil_rev_8_21_14_0_20_47_16]